MSAQPDQIPTASSTLYYGSVENPLWAPPADLPKYDLQFTFASPVEMTDNQIYSFMCHQLAEYYKVPLDPIRFEALTAYMTLAVEDAGNKVINPPSAGDTRIRGEFQLDGGTKLGYQMTADLDMQRLFIDAATKVMRTDLPPQTFLSENAQSFEKLKELILSEGTPMSELAPTLNQLASGQTSQPIDITFSQLATAVYGRYGGPPEGWREINKTDIAERLGVDHDDPKVSEWFRQYLGGDHAKDGDMTKQQEFKAQIYTDDKGNFVLSYRGTAEGYPDWKNNNASQAIGLPTDGVNDKFSGTAVSTAKEFSKMFSQPDSFGKPVNLAIVGHSQGGALAAAASIDSGIPAVTFNASGLHPNTLARMGVSYEDAKKYAENGNIRAISLKDDPLTQVQEKSRIAIIAPDAMGTKIVVNVAQDDEGRLNRKYASYEGVPELASRINEATPRVLLEAGTYLPGISGVTSKVQLEIRQLINHSPLALTNALREKHETPAEPVLQTGVPPTPVPRPTPTPVETSTPLTKSENKQDSPESVPELKPLSTFTPIPLNRFEIQNEKNYSGAEKTGLALTAAVEQQGPSIGKNKNDVSGMSASQQSFQDARYLKDYKPSDVISTMIDDCMVKNPVRRDDASDETNRNLSAALMLAAARSNVDDVSLVMLNKDGTRLIAVQGNERSEFCKTASVLIEDAIKQPAQESLAQIAQIQADKTAGAVKPPTDIDTIAAKPQQVETETRAAPRLA